MTEPVRFARPVRFAEPGSTWWPVLWGPAFAGLGAGVEAMSGRPHLAGWLVVGVGLAGLAALWVRSRRRLLSVSLTADELVQGQESLAVRRIADVVADQDDPADGAAPVGARVLGGGWTVPRKLTGVPLRLDDGSVVLAWARDGERLRSALRAVLVPPESS
ncbi:MAG: hypothetical protein ACJ72N_02850 [Labedaea sp.]